MFCQTHMPRGLDAMSAAGHDCPKCNLQTYADFQMCDACSLEHDLCQRCGQPAHSGRGLITVFKVRSARKQYNKAIAAAKAAFAGTVAPFKNEAADYEAARQAANEELETALAPTRAEVQPFADKVNEIQAARGNTQEAYAAFHAARERVRPIEEPIYLAYQAKLQAAEARFASHKETYEQAQRAERIAQGTAQQQFEAKVTLLASPFVAQQNFDMTF